MLMVNVAGLKEKMLRFQIPTELKDDLVYCQRSLRHFVKVHQLLAAKLSNGLNQSQTNKLKGYLRELEAEIVEIGNEQRPLVKELDLSIRSYLKQLATSELLEDDWEIAYGYVTRALSVHYEMSFNTKYTPRNVTERLNEAQLVHKYELASFDDPRPKKEKDESRSSTSSSISPTTIYQNNQKQISLLKPKEERVASRSSSSATQPPFSNITFSNAKSLVNEAALNQITPELIVVPKKLIRALPPPLSEALPRPIATKAPPKELQIKSETDYEPQELPATVAIEKSRLNLRQALNKAKNSSLSMSQPAEASKPTAMVFTRQTKAITKTKSDPLPSKRLSVGGSSDSSPNSRSSTPISAKASDDSVDRAPNPIEEYIEPQPNDIYELEQPVFLKFFGLLTLEESKALATRKTERKRRSCNSTERKDFHYGKIDYYEQQMHHITRRRNKRPILYSPPATRGVKKREHFENIASSTGAGTIRSGSGSSGSSSASSTTAAPASTARVGDKLVLTELENKICIVCSKSGSSDTLSACVYCCNIYHLRCHSNSIFNPQLLRQRDNICPVCLQKKQQATVAQQNQQRDQVLRKRLLRRNALQRARNDQLQQRKQTMEELYQLKQTARQRLVDQEKQTLDQISSLLNCLSSLRHHEQ
ncbi:uncharacterized protein LOC129718630 [Wyeomyia smithii]|uniref:uncharacterized protein LOC129718630 n=1 Tax=Wyeomyia smithii TaxID=174621 RepID=UPI002467E62E|nr:uncharacterized protein LOC129718630 [Wyeomyia smithii]